MSPYMEFGFAETDEEQHVPPWWLAVQVSGHGMGSEEDRIRRLHRVIGDIRARNPRWPAGLLLDLCDWKGCLTVTWGRMPTAAEKEAVRIAWEEEFEQQIEHTLDGYTSIEEEVDDLGEGANLPNPLSFREYVQVMQFVDKSVRSHLGVTWEKWESPADLREILRARKCSSEGLETLDAAERAWGSHKGKVLSYRDHMDLAHTLQSARQMVVEAMVRLGTCCGVVDEQYQDTVRALDAIAECMCGLCSRLRQTHRQEADEFDPYMGMSAGDIRKMLDSKPRR